MRITLAIIGVASILVQSCSAVTQGECVCDRGSMKDDNNNALYLTDNYVIAGRNDLRFTPYQNEQKTIQVCLTKGCDSNNQNVEGEAAHYYLTNSGFTKKWLGYDGADADINLEWYEQSARYRLKPYETGYIITTYDGKMCFTGVTEDRVRKPTIGTFIYGTSCLTFGKCDCKK
jgi:hypothetical protein